MLPHTEVATDAMLLKYGAHISDVYARNTRLSDETIRNSRRVVVLVATGNIDDEILFEATDDVSVALDLRSGGTC